MRPVADKQNKWLRYVIAALAVGIIGFFIYLRLAPGAVKGGIAFVANKDGNWDLFIMNPDGSGLRQLTETPIDERSPAFSRDGKQLAYATSDGALWYFSSGSRSPARIELPAGRYGYPTWMSDGGGIIYTSYIVNPPNEDADFYLYSFKEQKPRMFLTQTGPQDFSALSPTRDQFAYISSLATLIPGFGSTVTQQLWVASLRDGKPTQLLLGSAHDTRPAWSPDGKRIVFTSGRGGSPDLWVVNADGADGQELVQLTNSPAAETSPAWSPDGQKIVYVSNESEKMQLMMLDVSSKKSSKLSPFGANSVEVKDPAWK
jgi:TolB protein